MPTAYPKADLTVDRTPTVTYDVLGTGPFAVTRDGDHGTFRIKDAAGKPARVTMTVAAVAGFEGAVVQTTEITFATQAEAAAVAAAG